MPETTPRSESMSPTEFRDRVIGLTNNFYHYMPGSGHIDLNNPLNPFHGTPAEFIDKQQNTPLKDLLRTTKRDMYSEKRLHQSRAQFIQAVEETTRLLGYTDRLKQQDAIQQRQSPTPDADWWAAVLHTFNTMLQYGYTQEDLKI